METYLKIPVCEINQAYDISMKLNILNNQLNNKIYDDYSINLLNDNYDDDIDYRNNKYNNCKSISTKRNNKNPIQKAIFYMKISDDIDINNNIFKHNILKCPICYNTILNKNNYMNLQCNHTFCNECYVSWNETCITNNTDTTCPLCREISV